jgi:hypothetical protein
VSSAEVPSAGNSQLDPSVVAALYVEHGEELRRFLLGIFAGCPAHVRRAPGDVRAGPAGQLRRVSSRKAWLFRVAYHEAMAHRRRQGVGDRCAQCCVHCNASQVMERLGRLRNPPPARGGTIGSRGFGTFAARATSGCADADLRREDVCHNRSELRIPLGPRRMRAALIKLRVRLSNPDNDERKA